MEILAILVLKDEEKGPYSIIEEMDKVLFEVCICLEKAEEKTKKSVWMKQRRFSGKPE